MLIRSFLSYLSVIAQAGMAVEGVDALVRAEIDLWNDPHNLQRKRLLFEANKGLLLTPKLSRKWKNNFNSFKPIHRNFKSGGTVKKKGNFYYCGKSGYFKLVCRKWISDQKRDKRFTVSGATHNFFYSRSSFTSYQQITEETVKGATLVSEIVGKGKYNISIGSGVTIEAFHDPGFSSNIVPIRMLFLPSKSFLGICS